MVTQILYYFYGDVMSAEHMHPSEKDDTPFQAIDKHINNFLDGYAAEFAKLSPQDREQLIAEERRRRIGKESGSAFMLFLNALESRYKRGDAD